MTLSTFRGKEYDEHKSCITEKQKYGGANVVVKPQGVKQVQWAEMASEVLEEMSHNNRYRKICLALKSSTNIPRNRNKFHVSIMIIFFVNIIKYYLFRLFRNIKSFFW